ncbi:MAG: hypothetical protein M0R17_05215 [Candidatus Omnitrophica bacterium]|jgi:hypothetical protein|nr:hypothetical protein [Candidatus Omnitrophota bacterium]
MFEYTISELKGLWSALKDMKKVVKPKLKNEIDNHITEIKQVIAILASAPLRIKQAHDQKEQEILEAYSEDQSRKVAKSLTKGHQE